MVLESLNEYKTFIFTKILAKRARIFREFERQPPFARESALCGVFLSAKICYGSHIIEIFAFTLFPRALRLIEGKIQKRGFKFFFLLTKVLVHENSRKESKNFP